MNRPQVVSAPEWQVARDALLVQENNTPAHWTRWPPSGAGCRWSGWTRTTRLPRPTARRWGSRTYFTNGRGVDRFRLDFNLLDLTPHGRQEEWEDSPEGWPQTPTMQWIRLHDEYDR